MLAFIQLNKRGATSANSKSDEDQSSSPSTNAGTGAAIFHRLHQQNPYTPAPPTTEESHAKRFGTMVGDDMAPQVGEKTSGKSFSGSLLNCQHNTNQTPQLMHRLNFAIEIASTTTAAIPAKL
ncbi:Uncharacterized protein Fot_15082 [Forsythia ovata]|uniref:Uncharacterized protein n=1 Tax=Forsythia ovata TaxID=205694 RepID=A0ABD1W856_9LAMI